MNEMKSPEDILDEIMNRPPAPIPGMEAEPDPTPSPSRFDPPEDIPPPPPEAPGKTNPPSGAAKAVPWLCAALAVSLVLLGVCVFRMVKTSSQLDELEISSAEALAEADRLRQENTALEQTRERQQSRIEEMQAQLRENTSNQSYWLMQYADEYTQRKQLDYLWYLTQFMEHEDYPMAALIFAYWTEDYWSNFNVDVPKNVTQVRQYRAYRQQLIDQGYLTLSIVHPGQVTLTEKWDTSRNPDMAALGILWCALNAHYVDNNPNLAAHFLVQYQTSPLDNHGGSYPEYLRNAASDYTMGLCEQLLSELMELEEYLTVADGLLKYGPASQEYPEMTPVPFDLPIFYGITIPEGTTRTD